MPAPYNFTFGDANCDQGYFGFLDPDPYKRGNLWNGSRTLFLVFFSSKADNRNEKKSK